MSHDSDAIELEKAEAEKAAADPGDFDLSVEPDPPDPRDQLYPPEAEVTGHHESEAKRRLREVMTVDDSYTAFVEGPTTFECLHYRELADPTWRQRGQECTGFALAAIAHYHLRSDLTPHEWLQTTPAERRQRTVSRRMMYEMAQVHDRRDFDEGSTLRGALKGWQTAGVASDESWPYEPGDEHGEKHGSLTMERVLDAVARPGGLYLRVDRTDAESMRDALNKGFPLFVSAQTHVGWFDLYMPGHDIIEIPDNEPLLGGHAFVIYGYNERGWLIHNSWGPEWGDRGFAVLPYDDFGAHGQDVWFVFQPRRVEPVEVSDPTGAGSTLSNDNDDMWLHRISIGDDGGLSQVGEFGMNADEIGTQLYLFRQRTRQWKQRRLAIFADGGYSSSPHTLAALEPFCRQLMEQEIYPLFMVWDTSFYDGLRSWLYGEAGFESDGRSTSSMFAPPQGPASSYTAAPDDEADVDELATEFGEMWSVLSKFLAAEFSAPRIWRQVRALARAACEPQRGAAWILADRLAYNRTKAPFEVHLIGHGAGDLILSELASMLPGPITSCQLWAPTTPLARFADTYGRLLGSKQLHHVHVVALAAAAERADSTGPVPGSFLQLVSDVLAVDDLDLDQAVEDQDGVLRWLPEAVPLTGLSESLAADPLVGRLRERDTLRTTILDQGTHIGLLSDPKVWRATIDSLNAHPSGTPEALGVTDETVEANAWLPPVAKYDPLDWVIRHTTRG